MSSQRQHSKYRVHKGVPTEKTHYKKPSNHGAFKPILNKQIQHPSCDLQCRGMTPSQTGAEELSELGVQGMQMI
jgi:hypothetical protein